MLDSQNFMIMTAACGAVLLIGIAGRRLGWLIRFCMRAAAGMLGVYLVNLVLSAFQIPLSVGLNLFNMLIVGALGLPGFGLLYAISAVNFM